LAERGQREIRGHPGRESPKNHTIEGRQHTEKGLPTQGEGSFRKREKRLLTRKKVVRLYALKRELSGNSSSQQGRALGSLEVQPKGERHLPEDPRGTGCRRRGKKVKYQPAKKGPFPHSEALTKGEVLISRRGGTEAGRELQCQRKNNPREKLRKTLTSKGRNREGHSLLLGEAERKGGGKVTTHQGGSNSPYRGRGNFGKGIPRRKNAVSKTYASQGGPPKRGERKSLFEAKTSIEGPGIRSGRFGVRGAKEPGENFFSGPRWGLWIRCLEGEHLCFLSQARISTSSETYWFTAPKLPEEVRETSRRIQSKKSDLESSMKRKVTEIRGKAWLLKGA